MSPVPDLLRAELLKIRTSRTTWTLLGVMALVTIAVVALTLSNLGGHELAGARGMRRVLTLGAGVACFFTLTLGVLGMAGEYRYGTIGQALMAAPNRWPVVVAKALAYAAAGIVFGVVALAVTFAVGAPGLAAEDARVSYPTGLLPYVLLGTPAVAAAFAVIGVGLAALLRDQTLALGVGLGWLALIDNLVAELSAKIGKFLPGGAVTSLLHSETHDVLPAGFAAILLLAYAVAFAVAGASIVRRRDVT